MRDEADIQSIKYRLVGALVVIVSFSLAWFLLLDHDVKRQSQWQTDLPEAIKIERFTVIEEKADTEHTKNTGMNSIDSASSDVEMPTVENTEMQKKPVVSPQQNNASQNEELSSLASSNTSNIGSKTKSKTEASKKNFTQLNKKGLPQAWVLQVASFKDQSNARDLQQSLLKQDFPAYVKRFNVANGQIYRVLIGPKMKKKTLSLMAKKVERQLGKKTLMVTYKPEYAQK